MMANLASYSPTRTTLYHFRRKGYSFYGYLILIPLTPGRIEEDGSSQEYYSLTEIRSGSRMEKRLTEERGGGIKKEREDPNTERRG